MVMDGYCRPYLSGTTDVSACVVDDDNWSDVNGVIERYAESVSSSTVRSVCERAASR